MGLIKTAMMVGGGAYAAKQATNSYERQHAATAQASQRQGYYYPPPPQQNAYQQQQQQQQQQPAFCPCCGASLQASYQAEQRNLMPPEYAEGNGAWRQQQGVSQAGDVKRS